MTDLLAADHNERELEAGLTEVIEQVSEIIKTQMRLFIVDGIKYHRIGLPGLFLQLVEACMERRT